jgi:hypothetical protein
MRARYRCWIGRAALAGALGIGALVLSSCGGAASTSTESIAQITAVKDAGYVGGYWRGASAKVSGAPYDESDRNFECRTLAARKYQSPSDRYRFVGACDRGYDDGWYGR